MAEPSTTPTVRPPGRRWYRSLYWRIALGFMFLLALMLGGVLVVARAHGLADLDHDRGPAFTGERQDAARHRGPEELHLDAQL